MIVGALEELNKNRISAKLISHVIVPEKHRIASNEIQGAYLLKGKIIFILFVGISLIIIEACVKIGVSKTDNRWANYKT